ncbi:MAG: FKBP-type peptidyl-prolyl cis-trans isomerase [Gammaproteobacteria bacterium]
MQVEDGRVVSFHYRLLDENGEELESSAGGEPVSYLHGHGGIIEGLGEAMAGRAAGDSFTETIAPERAYGPRHDDAMQRVPKKHIAEKVRLRPGMVVTVGTEQGPRQVQVVKVGKFVVDVDTNHPLAGRTLTFEVEVTDVREATDEEKAHGHAHGPGGHEH